MGGYEISQLIIYIAAGALIGFILHTWVMPLLSKLAGKTSIKSDDLIIRTINKWVIPWFLALGLFLGLKRISMEPRYHAWLDNGLLIFYIFSVTLIVATVVAGMVRIKSATGDAVIPSSSIIGNIIRIIIYCIGFLVILQSLGISVTPVLTALGVGGLAVALALQNTLSNLFAGLQIIASGKFNNGDFVKLSSGEEGYIHDITWRSTSILALPDHIIVVPNAKLADLIVNNYNLPGKEVGFSIELGVSYESDLEQVEEVTKEVIRQTMREVEGGVKDFEPVIRFFAFGDSSINLRAILRAKEYTMQHAIRHEFIKNLHKRYREEGINIPFPIRTVLMENSSKEREVRN